MTSESKLSEVLERFIFGLFVAAESGGADQLAELDLSLSQARTLFTVSHHEQPLPIHVIAEKLTMSVTAAGRNVDSLVRLGLLTREECPGDRRVKLVGLSERGRNVIRDQAAVKRASLDTFAHRLPDHLRADLCAVLTNVLDSGALTSSDPPTALSGDQQ
ncbi:MarR family winged helix-turn-helix transcriptional regulator [Nocardia donostiensis]|uniref:HTH marR-type domain-containing protein n=1 Tax=Nocardia donostiensis TaxID=1538463 RepID=A0A1V2TH39_9NOCA|nr:MarR family transcriptional regulator [Nocardia donostiensis]ONM48812.1 hypothetical protein B0T46_09995 [Nocardia donostiensis]OQS12988.1 hypothetical protein B0T36_21960 [Nocardia donostiensis]OQS22933.1 hypothetical protein B0T44_04470 [Nocardia donostiensis]